MINFILVFVFSFSTIAFSQPDNIYGSCQSCSLKKPSEDYTTRQKIQQGIIVPQKYTTCRLKKRVKTKSGQQVCIYQGGNKTYEMMIETWCPRQYKCKYNPGQEEPNIDAVIESLNSIK